MDRTAFSPRASIGATSSDNDITSTGSTILTVAQMEIAILATIRTFYGFVDDRAVPINRGARNFTVMTGISQLWDRAQAAVSQALEIWPNAQAALRYALLK